MWIDRPTKKAKFINDLIGLDKQVLIVKGARQVGKTSFILNALSSLSDHPQLKLNLLYPDTFQLDSVDYFGRNFFGHSETGEDLIKNIETKVGTLKKMGKPLLVFIDELDRYPIALESIQTLAAFSNDIKFVITGSNLENIPVKNAATGRKKFFDLYPITFSEFVQAGPDQDIWNCLSDLSLKEPPTEYYHKKLCDALQTYVRIGGMPKIVDAFYSAELKNRIPEIIKDLAVSIEENVKTVLGEKAKLYEYEDVLRKIALLSMNTLKYSQLQVQYAGRSEAKKLLAKTVGARVAHKIRLLNPERDLSKYIIFDCGIANYLLNGSELLTSKITEKNMAILLETFVGNEIIANLVTRDDLLYWKSENKAEVEFMLKSPFIGIDVKTKKGDSKSLNSFAIFEEKVSAIVKICDTLPLVEHNHLAKLPTGGKTRTVPFIAVPHYFTSRLIELVKEVLEQ